MSALTDLQKLILWCRKNGIAWNNLTCGTLTIEGGDLRLTESLPASITKDTPRQGIRSMYGGDLLKQGAQSEGMTSIVELDD